ncbi:MAG: alpha-galactosidase [Fervidobacterium sp.]|nr:alpha-galactosidase [Fervidobacterium sp.]
MFVSSLNSQELKKITGYRKSDSSELLIQLEKIHLGYKVVIEAKGVLDELEVFSLPKPERLLINNWQSWGPTRVIDKNFKLDFPSELIQKFGFSASIMPDVYFERLISDYFICSDNFVIGALESRFGHPYFEIHENSIVVKLKYFGKVLDDWTRLESFVILFTNPDIGLPHYADLIARENKVVYKRKNLIGWSSWYQYFLDFDYDKLCSNLSFSKDYNYDVFQIDDAWEKDIGDWEVNDKFESLEIISTKIREYGYTPGIWLAPFSVAETSKLYNQHPDWVVKDCDGNPVVAYENWNKKIYALDTTNPDVAEWLSKLFYKLKKLGFDYFKIDFLFAGAIQGKRYKDVTPVEAYRMGMSIIRHAVGESFVLGCGAPLLPSVGYVDGMRISADTAPHWDPNGPDIGYPNAYYALRNVLTRAFMNNVLWWNDPDCLMLRKENTQLNDCHRELYAYVSLLLDNMIIQSDNLSLEIDKKLWDFILEYRKFGKRFFKVEGILDGEYRITSCAINGCDKLIIKDLKQAKFDVFLDKKGVGLVKNVEKREDGRTFNYYTESKIKLEGEEK